MYNSFITGNIAIIINNGHYVCKALTESLLYYVSIICSELIEHNLKQLEEMQNCIVKMIFKKCKRYPITELHSYDTRSNIGKCLVNK